MKCFKCEADLGVNSSVLDDEHHADLILVLKDEAESLENRTDRTFAENSFKKLSDLLNVDGAGEQIDCPVCGGCVHDLEASLELKLERAHADLQDFEIALREWQQLAKNEILHNSLKASSTSAITGIKEIISAQDFRNKLEHLEREKSARTAELKQLREQIAVSDHEIASLEAEMAELELVESRFWEECNEAERDLETYRKHMQSLELRKEHAVSQLERLQKVNVLHDAFRIWHSGNFGTINDLRLGKQTVDFGKSAASESRDGNVVPWSEINAAMGQTVLLLDVLAEKLDVRFSEYRLVPLGSFSQIQRLAKVKGDSNFDILGNFDKSDQPANAATFDLFYHSELKSFLFKNNSFSLGLKGLLTCLDELREKAETLEPKFKLPYTIDLAESCVGGCSVVLKATAKAAEDWTLAMKHFLVNCKWLIAFVSN